MGITTSVTAVRLIVFPEIVRSVPSPSIFSPSSPKVKPMFEPIFISPLPPTVIDRSVPSDSIFSVPANKSPVFTASATSVVAVKLIVFPAVSYTHLTLPTKRIV